MAKHGLALYLYAGEDVPEAPAPKPKAKTELKAKEEPVTKPSAMMEIPPEDVFIAPVLDPKVLGELAELNIDIEKVAVYKKKKTHELTNDDLRDCIEMKKRALAKKAEGQNNG